MGFIGLGNRGSQLLSWFMENDDVEVAALCDVYEPYIFRDRSKVSERYLKIGKVPKLGQPIASNVKKYKDYRRLLEQNDIDAVCYADHWHALQTIHALEPENTYTKTYKLPFMKKKMIDAQKIWKVCAVGLNRRGSSIYQHLAKEVKMNNGKVTTARAQRTSNMYPNGMASEPEVPPKGFDLGYGWVKTTGHINTTLPLTFSLVEGIFITNGELMHYMDVIRWMTGECQVQLLLQEVNMLFKTS